MYRSILRRSQCSFVPGLTGALAVVAIAACADEPTSVGPTAPAVGADIVQVDAALASCGIGYWKNHVADGAWGPTGYSPEDGVGAVFGDAAEPYQGHMLIEALGLGGGPGVDGAKAILVRAAVAALLNAAHPDVDFGMSEGDVIAAVNAALDGGNRKAMLEFAGQLDEMNDGTCDTGSTEPGDPDLPDLIVEQIVFGEGDGTRLPRTATIKNVGTAPVDVNGVGVQGYYSVDTVLEPGVDAAACGRVASTSTLILDPGETLNVTSNCGLPAAEHVYLLIMVDHGLLITESDETNNVGVAELPTG